MIETDKANPYESPRTADESARVEFAPTRHCPRCDAKLTFWRVHRHRLLLYLWCPYCGDRFRLWPPMWLRIVEPFLWLGPVAVIYSYRESLGAFGLIVAGFGFIYLADRVFRRICYSKAELSNSPHKK